MLMCLLLFVGVLSLLFVSSLSSRFMSILMGGSGGIDLEGRVPLGSSPQKPPAQKSPNVSSGWCHLDLLLEMSLGLRRYLLYCLLPTRTVPGVDNDIVVSLWHGLGVNPVLTFTLDTQLLNELFRPLVVFEQ